MESEQIIDEIGDRQGWDVASKLDLCLEYIENQGDNAAFREFLSISAETRTTAR